MRHSLEIKTVAQIKNAKGNTGLIRARYVKQMMAWGYTWTQAMDCFAACCEVADLELWAVGR
jgi:hypothetical protein